MEGDPSHSASPEPPSARPAMTIYQLIGDDLLRDRRTDGTGWSWRWASWERSWMDGTPGKFAYRCLPLTIANQTGWWLDNPVGFTALWNGQLRPGSVQFQFDTDPGLWGQWINDQFGQAIITWNTPFLFRTEPAGSRLLVCGPVNSFKPGVQALTAIIESDWMYMSFTMNWKMTTPGVPIRFETREPIMQFIPLFSDLFSNLEQAAVSYVKLEDAPEIAEPYNRWLKARKEFRQKLLAGQTADEWQKDYFQGRDMLGRPVTSGHRTRLTPPTVHFKSRKS
jgi:hypothetical protein